MSGKRWVKDYLHFTAKDRLGIVAIAGVMLAIFFWPKLSDNPNPNGPTPVEADSLITQLPEKRRQQQEWPDERPGYERRNYDRTGGGTATFTKGDRFPFDPNTLDEAGWQRLGLQARTIKTISNYRSKGGKFYKPEDLERIWGLPDGFYEWVKDYISIERKPYFKDAYPNSTVTAYERKERRYEPVAVNSTDTSALVALPGIGSKLAFRIINFRNKLGGFYSVNQIGETYGLPDSTFQKIKPMLQVDASAVKKININTATKDELKMHPYIRWNLANAIVEYRTQHGAFASIEDVRKIELVDDATFEKIKHYLTL